MNTPPHLPPPACDRQAHQLWQNLRLIFLAVVVAIPASLAVTLATITWILPVALPEGLPNSVNAPAHLVHATALDVRLLAQARQRLWSVYDTRTKIGNRFYTENSRVGIAAMLSSDGWAVMALPDASVLGNSQWEGIDYQGVSYRVEKVVTDPIAHLLYIKFTGRALRVMSLSDWSIANTAPSGWLIAPSGVEEISWQEGRSLAALSRLIWQPLSSLSIIPDTHHDIPTVIINQKGELIGVVGKDNILHPSWLVETQLGTLLSRGQLEYRGWPWRGYMVHGNFADQGTLRHVRGFYVTDAPTKATDTTVGPGDLITQISGRSVDDTSALISLLSSVDTATVTVWRNGQEQDLTLPKVVVGP